MSRSLFSFSHIHKTFGQTPVLRDVSFQVYPGEIVGLLGPNGAGKTTSFHLAMGIFTPDQGKIFFQKKEISSLPVHQRACLGLGYLAQEPSIFRGLTVEENLLCVMEILRYDKETQQKQLQKALKELRLTKLRQKYAESLSGGERRRLEIARALLMQPSLFLLDEPFANVDPKTIQDVKKLILELKKKGISMLITDHNARELLSIVDRAYILIDGKVFFSGTKKQLLSNEQAVNSYFGEDFAKAVDLKE